MNALEEFDQILRLGYNSDKLLGVIPNILSIDRARFLFRTERKLPSLTEMPKTV